jgi:hypothetical protein
VVVLRWNSGLGENGKDTRGFRLVQASGE